jgi:hypothetical protein
MVGAFNLGMPFRRSAWGAVAHGGVGVTIAAPLIPSGGSVDKTPALVFTRGDEAMHPEKVGDAVVKVLRALHTDQANSENELVIMDDDLDNFIVQIASVRSAFQIERYLVDKI